MKIDLNEEEWEFLQRMCTRAVALAEMAKDGDKMFSAIPNQDYLKAKELLRKFITTKYDEV